MMTEKKPSSSNVCRILSLDGGGAKGFYTLGVLKEIEALLGDRPLCERFNLVFGTSTGAIIAALIALGYKVDEIHDLYKKYVPVVMKQKTADGKSTALANLAKEVFGDAKFEDAKTYLGIVATRWVQEKPMIFKASIEQAHGRQATFIPGWGVPIAEAVQASCSAYPFFNRKIVTTSSGDKVELVDGGFCANNPTLFAISEALEALKYQPENVRVISIGVGVYPQPRPKSLYGKFINWLPSVRLLQKTLEINTQSMDQLRALLFKHVPTIRISDTFERPEMATDLMEHDLDKLNILRQRGADSYAERENQLKDFFHNDYS